MKKIVYILGLGHSGTTILDILLSSHPKIIGLGEVVSTIQRLNEPQRRCSCGEVASECPVWSQLISYHNKTYDLGLIYKRLLEIVYDLYGDVVISDSSKKIDFLRLLLSNFNDHEIYPLYIIKDVRSFMSSKDKMEKYYRSIPAFRIYSWYKGNKRIIDFLKLNRLKYLQFGYEEFCFNNTLIINKIFDFLKLDYNADDIAPYKSINHMLRGNMVMYDSKKLAQISYDSRWLLKKSFLFYSPLLQPIFKFNVENVYSNTMIPMSK